MYPNNAFVVFLYYSNLKKCCK